MASASPAHSFRITVPATSANLGPGFDCLGIALNLRNELVISSSGPDLPYDGNLTQYAVQIHGVDADKVPADTSNLAVQAAESVFRRVKRRPTAMQIEMANCIPVGSGLGSSSAAIIAGLAGANALYENVIAPDELLRMAVAMEGHPDNVAPAMLGGLVLGVLPDSELGPAELIVQRWDPPPWATVLVLPDFHLLTHEARAVLPPKVTRVDAIFNTSRLALLIHLLTTGNAEHLRVAMSDRLHQTHRLNIIPGAAAAHRAAYEAGALGVALSGAGPSLIAFTTGRDQAVADSMTGAFAAAGLDSRVWFLKPSPQGVEIAAVAG